MALVNGKKRVATSMGHSPVAALLDPVAGSRTAIAARLYRILFGLYQRRLDGISYHELDVGL
jgi:phosphoribosylformylglycinamidine synthase